jgi:hypothetical protein
MSCPPQELFKDQEMAEILSVLAVHQDNRIEPIPNHRAGAASGRVPNALVISCRACSRSERSMSSWLAPSTVSVLIKLPPRVSCIFRVTT